MENLPVASPPHNYKLSKPQRMEVFALIARGDSNDKINAHLQKNYQLSLSPGMYSYMKTKHADTIEAIRSTIQSAATAEATSLLNKSRKILGRKLDRLEQDAPELEELDRRYRNKEISHSEYKRRKSTLLNATITEIAMVSKNLHEQTKVAGDGSTPPSQTSNPAQTEALIQAIKDGNEVELQRIILNPQGSQAT